MWRSINTLEYTLTVNWTDHCPLQESPDSSLFLEASEIFEHLSDDAQDCL